MLKSIIPLSFLVCFIAVSCHQNKTQAQLIDTFIQNRPNLDLLVNNIQKDKTLDSLFVIIPDSGIPDIKDSYPNIYAMIKKVGITGASSCKNSSPKGTHWYYLKTDWSNEDPIYLIFNAYDSSETKKGFYSKDEVSNETWGLGGNWKMFRFVKFRPYKQ